MAGLSPQSVMQLSSAFNTGIDRTVVLVDDQNNYINLGKVLDIHTSPELQTIVVNPINNGGRTLRKMVYNGWKGEITVIREHGVLDALQAAEESRYHNGGGQRYYTIYETTLNPSGTLDEYQYVKCVIRLEDAGTWRKESDVNLKISFECEERLVLQSTNQ